jgi:integrase
MSNEAKEVRFHSPLAPLMRQFVEEKRACGHRYYEQARLLARFDRALASKSVTASTLPRAAMRRWLTKQPHESPGTHQHRISIARQFAQFMCRLGYLADVPPRWPMTRETQTFVPYIFTRSEIAALLDRIDHLPPSPHSPDRHLIMPEISRLLYGCGFRVNEVLQLRVADVDLDQGVLTVRDGKFGKDRLVPPHITLVQRLRRYADLFGKRPDEAFFFPSRQNEPYRNNAVYLVFRKALFQLGIPHGGKSKGPRVHDLRHGFAVHTLLRWYEEGADLNAKLPILATYLGHQTLNGTQRYLHFTAELFPEISQRVNAAFGGVIPRRDAS